jgi:LAO/AO transport system kinase
MGAPRLTPDEYVAGVLAGDRAVLSRAITLVESSLASDQALAAEVLRGVQPHAGASFRLGITGVPGVGKSTMIDALGMALLEEGRKVAVLAVDPSSQRTQGSILGDKTRMERLSMDTRAYVRPSPARGSLGGVTRATREAMLLCEAAGFNLIIVETVGVGQSETAVHGMVDFFLVLMLAGAGDELQGIKKGIMELADGVVINKADGENTLRARTARAEYEKALHLFPAAESGWTPPVLTASATAGTGIAEMLGMLSRYVHEMQQCGWLETLRRRQSIAWLHETVLHLLEAGFYQHPAVRAVLPEIEARVLAGTLPPTVAGRDLIARFLSGAGAGQG